MLYCNRCNKEITLEQYFMVTPNLWQEVCKTSGFNSKDVLCLDCFESLLGRPITFSDLWFPNNKVLPVNITIINLRKWDIR